MFDYNPFREFKQIMEAKKREAETDPNPDRDPDQTEPTEDLGEPTELDLKALGEPTNTTGLTKRIHREPPALPNSLHPLIIPHAEAIRRAVFERDPEERSEYDYRHTPQGIEQRELFARLATQRRHIEHNVHRITGKPYDPTDPVHYKLARIGSDHQLDGGTSKSIFDIMNQHYQDPNSPIHDNSDW